MRGSAPSTEFVLGQKAPASASDPMKIALLSRHDARHPGSWSGTMRFMVRALERHCGEVVCLGPAARGWYLGASAFSRALRVAGVRIDADHLLLLSRILGGIFRRRLAGDRFDVIFAPVASTELACLETPLPVVTYGDLTAALFRDYAQALVGLTKWSLGQTETIEQRALRRADRLVYASAWAARSAREDYGIPSDRVTVVPMGANLDRTPEREEVLQARHPGSGDRCRLLLIGVDWQRKGGSVALATMRELRNRGLDASLTVVGCLPPPGVLDPHLQVIRFLDKSVPEHCRRLEALYLGSDFLLFPSQREAYGVVCCEANAFALPVIASDAGGVPVVDGENGLLLPAGASPEAYADAIGALLRSPERYRALATGGRNAFESRLNWDAWGASMLPILRQAIACRGARRDDP